MKLIIVTGGTSTGKTSLSSKLKAELKSCEVISLDNYYDENHFLNEGYINWDQPSAFNFPLLESHLKKLFNNESIYKEKFIYGDNVHSKKRYEFKPKEYIVLEGIFSHLNSKILEMASYTIFLTSDEKIRFERRLEKNKNIYKKEDNTKFIDEWDGIIEPAFKKYILPFRENASLVLNTNKIKNEENELILNIKKMLVN